MESNSIRHLIPAVGLVAVFIILASAIGSHMDLQASWFPSEPAATAFELAVLAWVLSEIVNNVWSRMNSDAKPRDMGSYWVVVGAVWSAIVVTFASRGMGALAFSSPLQYLGIALIVAGIALREWAIWVLGRHFTVRVQIRDKARLVSDGPYRYVRHPSYTGGVLTIFGIALAAGSGLGMIYVLTVCLAAYHYRMLVEEKALREAFGKEYEEYQKRAWRLFPGF